MLSPHPSPDCQSDRQSHSRSDPDPDPDPDPETHRFSDTVADTDADLKPHPFADLVADTEPDPVADDTEPEFVADPEPDLADIVADDTEPDLRSRLLWVVQAQHGTRGCERGVGLLPVHRRHKHTGMERRHQLPLVQKAKDNFDDPVQDRLPPPQR